MLTREWSGLLVCNWNYEIFFFFLYFKLGHLKWARFKSSTFHVFSEQNKIVAILIPTSVNS